MKLLVSILFILSLFASVPAHASYFPDPTPTDQWDMLRGTISGGNFQIGSEIAGWDSGGTLRFHATVDAMANIWSYTAFYGPPAGSPPGDCVWKLFDGMNIYLATPTAGTTWDQYYGTKQNWILNLERGDHQGCVPEPATFIIFGMLAGSGLLAGVRKRRQRKKEKLI